MIRKTITPHKSEDDVDKQELGGVLSIRVIEGKLTRDTETIGKMDPFVQFIY